MAILKNKEQILAADDLGRETVAVPEWGGEVIVRQMTGAERDAWEMALIWREGEEPEPARARVMSNIRARLVALCAIDDSGARLFSDADAAALGRKNGDAIDRLYQAAKRLNRLTKADVAAAEKNSGPGPSADSTSA
jgi:hypothetical protein